jgi:hypothetical protein
MKKDSKFSRKHKSECFSTFGTNNKKVRSLTKEERTHDQALAVNCEARTLEMGTKPIYEAN